MGDKMSAQALFLVTFCRAVSFEIGFDLVYCELEGRSGFLNI